MGAQLTYVAKLRLKIVASLQQVEAAAPQGANQVVRI